MQYRVVYGNDEDNLAKKVNMLIGEGWQVQGGVSADENRQTASP